MTSRHGVAQSELLTTAAQRLSEARSKLDTSNPTEADLSAIVEAWTVYQAAFRAYTNPFKVPKVVT